MARLVRCFAYNKLTQQLELSIARNESESESEYEYEYEHEHESKSKSESELKRTQLLISISITITITIAIQSIAIQCNENPLHCIPLLETSTFLLSYTWRAYKMPTTPMFVAALSKRKKRSGSLYRLPFCCSDQATNQLGTLDRGSNWHRNAKCKSNLIGLFLSVCFNDADKDKNSGIRIMLHQTPRSGPQSRGRPTKQIG